MLVYQPAPTGTRAEKAAQNALVVDVLGVATVDHQAVRLPGQRVLN